MKTDSGSLGYQSDQDEFFDQCLTFRNHIVVFINLLIFITSKEFGTFDAAAQPTHAIIATFVTLFL